MDLQPRSKRAHPVWPNAAVLIPIGSLDGSASIFRTVTAPTLLELSGHLLWLRIEIVDDCERLVPLDQR